MRSADAAPREGFILPTTLLVMVLLTVMLTAAFILASAEFRATDNSLATSRALSLSQAGLENYWALSRSLDTGSTYDSVRITFSSGYADVVGQRVRAMSGGHLPLWLVRSIGTSTDPRQPGQSLGQRAVAQLAELNTGLIPARAAITAVNGILMVPGVPTTNTTNPISGVDNNFGSGVPGCARPVGSAADTVAYTVGIVPQSPAGWNLGTGSASNTYVKAAGGGNWNSTAFQVGETIVASGFSNAANNGIAVIAGIGGPGNNTLTVSKSPTTFTNEATATGKSISVTPGNYLGGAPPPTGNPEPLPSITSAYDSSHIDWQRVLNGDFSPDYTNSLPVPCSGGSCIYNSYYWTGNVTVPAGTQRGLLVANGDVTLSDGVHWDGIIIAGGRLIAYGGSGYKFVVHGMVVTGLGCGTGSCPATQDSIQRTIPLYTGSQLVWDWCYTHAAIGGLNGLVPLKNTWIDTWSLY